MRLTIRPYRHEDLAAVVDLWEACGLIAPQNDPQDDIRTKMQFQPELFMVADLEKDVVGTVMIGFEGHRGWINYLAVSPRHRCRGIGKALMCAAEDKLRGLDCPKINLQVRRSNAAVINFYRSVGFREDDVVNLGKRLK